LGWGGGGGVGGAGWGVGGWVGGGVCGLGWWWVWGWGCVGGVCGGGMGPQAALASCLRLILLRISPPSDCGQLASFFLPLRRLSLDPSQALKRPNNTERHEFPLHPCQPNCLSQAAHRAAATRTKPITERLL